MSPRELVHRSPTSPSREATLPDLTEAEHTIAYLVENGDGTALHEVAGQADAYRAYEERERNRERANHYTHLKILAEAGLGECVRRAYPTLTATGPPIEIAGRSVSRSTASRWRVLAIAQERNLLKPAIERVLAGGTLSTRRVVTTVEVNGVTRVSRVELLGLIGGSNIAALCRRAGIGVPVGTGVSWEKATRLCGLAGVDPHPLRPCLPRNRSRAGASRRHAWIDRERKRTGGQWDECYSRLRRLIDEFANLAPNQDTRYDAAYDHLYELEKFIGRRMVEG